VLPVSLAVAPATAEQRRLPPLAQGPDPYFPADGNRGYEVRHYGIHDRYVPRTDRLRGTTTIRARSRRSLSRFYVDLVLTPDRVRVDGRPARFAERGRHDLRITPARTIAAGKPFRVTVAYHGRPASIRADGVRTGVDLYFHRRGETIAMGEPQNAPWWFAGNETLTDKATFDVTIRVPRGEQAVSNGSLERRTSHGRWTSWHWRLAHRVTTYMVCFAAGRFRLVRGRDHGFRHVYAVSRRLTLRQQHRAVHSLRRSGSIVAWLQQRFGAYPFGPIGGVIPGIDLPYALETATRPVYWAGVDRTTVVHELAHQWFGDDVTLRRWRYVWLNEGFATYVEHLYRQDHGGPSVEHWLRAAYDHYAAGASFWKLDIDSPGPVRMWDAPTYVRGAMALVALRNRIGAATFATLLRRWVATYGGGRGVVGPQLEAMAEQVSGQHLGGFFSAWLSPGRPADTTANGLG
jgi:aminopeptidase N